MGVVWVVNYAVPEGKTGQQAVDLLQSRIEQLGSVKAGNYSVSCEMHQGKQAATAKVVHIMHNSEQPATCFAILDTNTCLVCDTLFDQLMLKLKDFYVLRKMSKMETKGVRYELGDFILKVGSVIMSGSIFKGVLVEVEYLACVVAVECWDLMQELLQGVVGGSIETTQHLAERRAELYEPADTVKQYLEHYQIINRASSMHQQQQQQQQMMSQQQMQQQMQQQPQQQQMQQQQQQQIPHPMNIMQMGHR